MRSPLSFVLVAFAIATACKEKDDATNAALAKEILEGKGVPASAIPPGAVVPEGCFPAPFSIYNAYDLVVTGAFKANASDVEGGVVAGGNVDLVDYEVGLKLPQDAGRDHLIVGGDLKFIRGSVSKGRVSFGGGAILENVNFFGGSQKKEILDFVAVGGLMGAFSGKIAAMTPNGTMVLEEGGPRNHLVLSGNHPNVNVWSVPLAELNKAWNIRVVAPEKSTAIVNVVGEGELNIDRFGVKFEGTSRNRMVVNFPGVTKMTMQAFGFDGGIIAPNADITASNGLITGQVIAKSFNGGAQINHDPFQGCIPVDVVTPPPATATPTPTAIPNPNNCTLTIGYWKNHSSEIPAKLPQYLGTVSGVKTFTVGTEAVAVDILKQDLYGSPSNMITKLYAQLLATKLNLARGASNDAVDADIAEADGLLAQFSHSDWGTAAISASQSDRMTALHDKFDAFNNGELTPKHCP